MNNLNAQALVEIYQVENAWDAYIQAKESGRSTRRIQSTIETTNNAISKLMTTIEAMKQLGVKSPFLHIFDSLAVMIKGELNYWRAEVAVLDTARARISQP